MRKLIALTTQRLEQMWNQKGGKGQQACGGNDGKSVEEPIKLLKRPVLEAQGRGGDDQRAA